jgi:hypothetical protein
MRLVGAYESKSPVNYQAMFTGDFTYEFSNSTDPTLVQQYATGWFKIDENESSNHLFNGYTIPGGAHLQAASAIALKLASMLPQDDNTSGLDPRTHKILETRVDGSVTVPASPNPLTYEINNNFNELRLVRGDAAVGLDSTQVADSLHWYVYRWVDLTEALAPASPTREPTPAQSTTWGEVKARYH